MLTFVAVVAVLLRAFIVPSANWTIRVVNVGREPIRDVQIAQDPKVWLETPSLATGKSIELKVRNPPREPGLLRYEVGGVGRAHNLDFQDTPGYGPAYIVHEYRLNEGGLQGASMTWEVSPFGCR